MNEQNYTENLVTFSEAKNVILDFDGIVSDTEVFQLMVWEKVIIARGLPITNLSIKAIAGISDNIAIRNILPNLEDNEYDAIVKEKKLLCEACNDQIYPVPYIGKLLTEINLRKKIHICSNSNADAIRSFLNIYFPDITIGVICGKGLFKVSKPDPEPYLTLIRMSKIRIDESVVIEDSIAGVTSAMSAGLKVIYLNRYGIDIENVCQITSLKTLLNLI